MEEYFPPILLVISSKKFRSILVEEIQGGYPGAVYYETDASAALNSLGQLYDVGIVAADEGAILPSGKHLLSKIKQMYPDCRRVMLQILKTNLSVFSEDDLYHDSVSEPTSSTKFFEMMDRQVPIRRELENKRIEVINMASQLNMIALSSSQLNMMLDMHLKNTGGSKTPRNIQKLTHHIRSLWDAERRRLAADIHDDLGQRLTAIQLGISALMYHPFPVEALHEMQLMQTHLSEMHTSVRNILNGLRSDSLEALGLIPAVKQLCTNVEKVSNISCILKSEVDTFVLDDGVIDCIYRVIQESLNNVMKHSEAKNVVIEIAQPLDGNYIQTTITDDGVGIALENIDFTPGYGVLGMRERAESLGGSLEIIAPPGGGTNVTLVAPL